MRGINWSDLYGSTPVQEVPLDEAGQSLLNLIPADRQPAFEPMLRGMLAQIRLKLGADNYVKFVSDMKDAHAYYTAGNHDEARAIFTAYGIPYDNMMA